MALIHAVYVIVAWILFYNYYWKRRNLPRGPIPHPLIGNLPVIVFEKPGTGSEIFLKWRKKYGSLFTFWIGEFPVVAVAEYDAIVESFVKNADAYTDRFTVPKMDNFFRGGTLGVVFTDGDLWREQRRFALTVLRDLGMGRNVIEEKVLDEVTSLLESLRADCAVQESDTPWRFEVCVGSIINSILFGYRFEGEKLEEFYQLKRVLSSHMRALVDPATMLLVQELDVLKHVFRGSYKMLETNKKLFFDFFDRQIEEHELELDMDSIHEPTDYVEAFLRQMHQNKQKGVETVNYSKQQLANMCLDLWFAGMETTANTLQFTVLFLIHNPKCALKLAEEFDRVVGSDRLVTLSDRTQLTYLQAVINESQRMANLLPQNLLHMTNQDVEICGQKLKKGTCIVPQISCVLFDEKYFPEPYQFKPERFIDDNGNLRKIEQFVPFSVGKRQCLGESLAKMELFLILGNVYNQFTISPVNPDKLPSLERLPGITWQPKRFKTIIQKRHI